MTSILQTAADLTGWSDDDLALILGISASTVQSYRLGRRTEYVNSVQRRALMSCARLEVDKAIDELERGYEALTRL